jgi:hypothetical protein
MRPVAPPYDAGAMSTYRVLVARAAALAQLVFVGGWLVIGALEGHGYRPMRHDISDLAALTAHHATADRVTLFVAGALTIAFAFALRHQLGNAALLLALSLPGLDSLSDTFFRLDCRAADAGCSSSDAMASWHGTVHVVVFVVSALATVAAPFVLARAMRRREAWVGLARPTKVFGLLTIALLVATGATTGTAVGGLAQRIAATFVTGGVAVLAWQAGRLATYDLAGGGPQDVRRTEDPVPPSV